MEITQDSLLNYIFHPRATEYTADDKDKLVQVEDDICVGIRLFLSDTSFSNILYFHGNAELAREYEEISKIYNDYGLNLIVADYRGYGLSNGKPTKDNTQQDALKIFEYVTEYLKKNKYNGQMVVMGRSIGSVSIAEIINHCESKVDKCIIESGFATEFPLLELLNISPASINFKLSDGFENLKKIKKYSKPLMIIHAEMDHIVPYEQGEILYNDSPSKVKELHKVEGANHNNILLVMGEDYFKKIKIFIS